MRNIRKCSFWVILTQGNKSKHKIKGFTHKLKAFTPVFEKLLFPFIYLLVWNFTKSKSKNKRKETVRKVRNLYNSAMYTLRSWTSSFRMQSHIFWRMMKLESRVDPWDSNNWTLEPSTKIVERMHMNLLSPIKFQIHHTLTYFCFTKS